MTPPTAVLRQYGPLLHNSKWQPLDGGLSGAALYRGVAPVGDVVLKRHSQGTPADRLHEALRAQQMVESLPFVPRLFATQAGSLTAAAEGGKWELCEWKAGQPLLAPTRNQVRAASQALAGLHALWRQFAVSSSSIPAIDRRLARLRSPLPEIAADTPFEVQELLRRVRVEVPPLAATVVTRLQAANRAATVHFCHGDPHGQQVLFTGEAVSGVVDFAAARLDHPAVDLARYLGDACGGDDALLDAGLEAYWSAGGSNEVTRDLVRLLDRAGTLGALLGWLSRPVPAWSVRAVAKRVRRMLRRVEKWRSTEAGEILR